MLIAFDGTWNEPSDEGSNKSEYRPEFGASLDHLRDVQDTNVVRFQRLYGDSDSLYLPGVGTRYGPLGKGIGGIGGAGVRSRVRLAYQAVCKRWAEGDDRLDIVGFSRGAATAIHFANTVRTLGIHYPARRPNRLPRWSTQLGLSNIPGAEASNSDKPTISFLGLWDSVGAFGIPVGSMREKLTFLDIHSIPSNVEVCAHALALDEYRRSFRPLRPTAHGETEKYEVWFRGVHSNVGGGYSDRGLSDIALSWMMHTALVAWRRGGLSVPPKFEQALDTADSMLDATPDWMIRPGLAALVPNPNGSIERPSKLPIIPHRWGRRKLASMDDGQVLVHHTATIRPPNHLDDHLHTNRPLTRRIPLDATIVFDPPDVRPPTREQICQSSALRIFRLIPVRPTSNFAFGKAGLLGYRGDHWCALGTAEQRWNQERPDGITINRESFLSVVQHWIKEDRPTAIHIPSGLVDYVENPLEEIPEVLRDQDAHAVARASVMLAQRVIDLHPTISETFPQN